MDHRRQDHITPTGPPSGRQLSGPDLSQRAGGHIAAHTTPRPPGARPPEVAKGRRSAVGKHHCIQQLATYTTKAHTTRRSTGPLRGLQVGDHMGPLRGTIRLTREGQADCCTLSCSVNDTNVALPPGALEWAPTQGPQCVTFDSTDEREGTSPPIAILRPPGARPPEAAEGHSGALGEHHLVQQLIARTNKAHTTRRSIEPLRGPQVDDQLGPLRGPPG